MKKEKEKYLQYAAQLTAAVADLLDADSDSEFHIDLKERELTQFFHALANLMPTMLYNKITGANKNHLEFNHIANMLCFQFSTSSKASDDGDSDSTTSKMEHKID